MMVLLFAQTCRLVGATAADLFRPLVADVAMADNVEVAASDVTLLQGHTSEVFTCAFNPRADILASGYAMQACLRQRQPIVLCRSGDATARIWKLPAASDSASRPSSSSSSSSSASSVVLKHASEAVKTPSRDKSQDVTTLDWNVGRDAWLAHYVSCTCPLFSSTALGWPPGHMMAKREFGVWMARYSRHCTVTLMWCLPSSGHRTLITWSLAAVRPREI
jgi:hypothetical protein